MFKEEPLTEVLNCKIYSIQHALNEHFGFKTADEPLFARWKQLARIPTTKYVGFKKVKKDDRKVYVKIVNGNYCRWLPLDDYRKGISKIKTLIKEPGELPPASNTDITIDDIVNVVPKYRFRKKADMSLSIDLEQGGTIVPTIDSIGLPCIRAIAQEKSPGHFYRIELAAWLKFLGYNDISIISFMSKLDWNNFDTQKTTINVSTIKPRFPKCSYLSKKHDYCNECSFKKNGEMK